MAATQTMTADEFVAVPAKTFPWATNLVDGEVVMGEPTRLHQDVSLKLVFALEGWVRAGAGRGAVVLPIDVGIDERNVYAPDVSWYPDGHESPEQPPYPVPHIAAEVRSPSTWRYDIGPKKSGYERGGLPELWLVDTAASEILVFRRSTPTSPTFDVSASFGMGNVLTSPLLPGFALPVEALFG